MCTIMKVLGTALTLCLIFVAGEALRQKRSTCTAKYSGQTPTHTMCLTDNSNAQAVDLTQEVKYQIVSLHNEIRRNVTDATNMMKMKWDGRLAAVAAKWAMQCTGGHDANRKEPDLPGFVGQNAAKTINNPSAAFAGAVMAWASEISVFQYGNWTSASGHYIQQIFHSAALVGCGQSTCGSSKYFICNYYTGTVDSVPYTKGSSCGGCSNSCNNGLCDCTSGPDACFNGGTMNIETCSCQCDSYWTGAQCKTANCPSADIYTQWCATLNTTLCSTHYFYPNTCPYRCDICS